MMLLQCGIANERRINMEELKNCQEARRYKAVDSLFNHKYQWEGAKLNYFELQHNFFKDYKQFYDSYSREETICKKYLAGEINFLELLCELENYHTLQTIVLDLEYSLPWEVSKNGK